MSARISVGFSCILFLNSDNDFRTTVGSWIAVNELYAVLIKELCFLDPVAFYMNYTWFIRIQWLVFGVSWVWQITICGFTKWIRMRNWTRVPACTDEKFSQESYSNICETSLGSQTSQSYFTPSMNFHPPIRNPRSRVSPYQKSTYSRSDQQSYTDPSSKQDTVNWTSMNLLITLPFLLVVVTASPHPPGFGMSTQRDSDISHGTNPFKNTPVNEDVSQQ